MEPYVEGGYSYQFIDQPLDLLICKICQLVSQNPYETTCCHNTFCKLCIETANRRGFRSCPLCRHQPVQITECVQLRRQIESLRVFCDNKEIGCEWVGEVDAIQRHIKQCSYCMVTCEYHIVGCNTTIPQHLMTEHKREKAEDHIFMVQQKVEELENTKVMLQQTNETLNSMKQELNRSKALLDVATVELQSTKAKLHDNTAKLNVSQTELRNTNKQLNETMDHLAHSQEESNDARRQLVDSEDQVNHTIKELLCVTQKLTVTEKELALVGSSLRQIKNHVKSNSFAAIKLEAISTKIPFEPRVVPTVFKMSQYMEKKEKDLKWYSGPFFTDDKGYKMCLRVSTDGDGKGQDTHLSVALCLMEGQYDDHLAWPLRGRFKVTLLNQQLKDDKNHSRIITYDDSVGNKIAGRVVGNRRAGPNECTQFISHSDIISSRQFLIDDCMYFQVDKGEITARTSACKYIFIFFYYLMIYYIVILIGMILLK